MDAGGNPVLSVVPELLFNTNAGGKLRTSVLLIALLVIILSAGIALADPDNFGGNGKAWTLDPDGLGLDYYEHKNTDSHTKNFNSSQGAGKRFSQPGKAEGKASGNSVISDDPVDFDEFHPGTQVLPGSN